MNRQTFTLEESLYRCNKCGFCQAACAHYRSTRQEWTSARGKLRLIRGVLEGEQPLSEGYVRDIYQCFTCGACSVTCPSGVQVKDILLEARQDLARNGRLPDALVQLTRGIKETGNLTGETNDRLAWAQKLDAPPPQGGKHDTVYFAGCMSSLYPDVQELPRCMVGLLERAGVDYTVLGNEETCCGYPLYISGQEEGAREMASANVQKVRETGASRLITGCPSCYRAWKEYYPKLLGGDPGVEVVHAAQWLADADLPLAPIQAKITYQDPCDLGRGSGLYDPPRAFLSRIDGLELLEMPSAKAEALCCGWGGNMAFQDPAESQSVSKLRMAQASGTGAEQLVTACPRCKYTLNSVEDGKTIPAVDIIELAWQSVSGI